jgi:isoamylase
VSYNEKHNDANGEGNNDGESHNRSWNCGAEGPSDDETIIALRRRQQRNFIATMLLSQGVPMLCHGDELGRTQNGNNNGYCQDNELTWINWAHADEQLQAFTAQVAAFRHQHPVFRRRRFFDGKPVRRRGQEGLTDIGWFRPDGTEMTDEDWGSGFGRSVAVFLNGEGIPDRDMRGERVVDDSFFVVFNAHTDDIEFTAPPAEYGDTWRVIIDTSDAAPEVEPVPAAGAITVAARSVIVLEKVTA